ncbi:helix-turn-helix domain-containing protein [Kitasatospora sp. NPDC058478]|uniref:helix-turn-helix domain-containing protein n=1 Tax=unclassified Kitasatospora TaxID=2633591 RepID=UPI003652BCEE
MAHRRFKRELTASSAELFGEELRFYRELASYTQEELGKLLHCSRTNITRYETGQRRMPPELVEKADELLNTGGALRRIWGKVDWNAQVEHPDWFQTHADMESEALGARVYQCGYMHGLLQCREYAQALFAAGGSTALIEERTTARLARQQRFLVQDGPLLLAVLDESTIRTVIGGPEVMYRQMEHLLAISELSNVIIEIAPFADRRTVIPTSMVLLEMPDGQNYVYSESLDRGHPSNDPEVVAAHRRVYDRLRSEVLPGSNSLALIRDALEGYKDDAKRARQSRLAEEQLQRSQRRRLHRGGPRIPRPRPRA